MANKVNKIRVVHVLHSFGTGGLEKGIATLIRHATPGIEHVIVCLTTSGASSRLLPPTTRVIELHKPPGNSLRFIWRLSRCLRDLRPEVVHTRNWSGMDGIIAGRLAGLRSVVHGEHGWGVEDAQGLSPKRVRVRRVLSRWVREYTCVAQAMVPWLTETVGVQRPVTQIYNGVDTQRYAPGGGVEIRREFGIGEEDFVVGIVGRLDPIKDHPTLFAAFKLLRTATPVARLLVVGDGPERARLEALAGDGVVFAGDRRDVPNLMRAMDVFALPSLNEGISNTILEAMATGLPVVATAVGGNPELVRPDCTGFLVAPKAPAELAEKLVQYAKNEDLRREHGCAGRACVLDGFAVQRMVEGYEAVWRRVAQHATGGM